MECDGKANAARLWRVAAEGLPLPLDCRVPSGAFGWILIRVAINNDHGDTMFALFEWLQHVLVPHETMACYFGIYSEPDIVNGMAIPRRATPLTWAARHGSCHAALSLLRARADINLHDGRGETPLGVAANHGQVAFVRLLVDAKASVNRVNDDEDGYAPVVVAIWKQHADVVSLLLERKANLDTIDGGADSPLDVEDHLRVALALVDAKADANAVAACSQERRTPLAYAAECGYGSVVMLLIRANADANEALQHPPVRQLVEKGRSVLVRLLRASKKATKKYAPTQYILSK